MGPNEHRHRNYGRRFPRKPPPPAPPSPNERENSAATSRTPRVTHAAGRLPAARYTAWTVMDNAATTPATNTRTTLLSCTAFRYLAYSVRVIRELDGTSFWSSVSPSCAAAWPLPTFCPNLLPYAGSRYYLSRASRYLPAASSAAFVVRVYNAFVVLHIHLPGRIYRPPPMAGRTFIIILGRTLPTVWLTGRQPPVRIFAPHFLALNMWWGVTSVPRLLPHATLPPPSAHLPQQLPLPDTAAPATPRAFGYTRHAHERRTATLSRTSISTPGRRDYTRPWTV